MKNNYLVYDAEIFNCIPSKGVPKDPPLSYCEGWGDFENMGISVVGFVDGFGSEAVFVFDMNDASQVKPAVSSALEYAASAYETIVSFNGLSFDDKLMAAHEIYIKTTYDLLAEVRIAAYGSMSWRDCPPGFSYKLDALARANGVPPKTGDGALAPVLWQQGKKQEVKDYCLHDVRITDQILRLGLAGELIDPNTGKKLQLSQF